VFCWSKTGSANRAGCVLTFLDEDLRLSEYPVNYKENKGTRSNKVNDDGYWVF